MPVASSDDLRQFIREMFLRQDRTWREQWGILNELVREVHDQVAELRALRLEYQAAQAEYQAANEETRLEHEAQRNALLHILDRLQNGGAQA